MHIDATGAWILLGACTLLVILFLAFEESSPLKKENSLFQSRVWAAAIWGGSLSFLLPIALDLGFGPNDDGRVMRQLLLYTTGGVLGVITLNETRRKNDLERSKFKEQQNQFKEQLKSQKDNIELQLGSQEKTFESQLKAQEKNLGLQIKAQEKNLELQLEAQEKNLIIQLESQDTKDKRDHNRQNHTERRSRYAKAVEQLAEDKAVVRLGGVYALVGLVDEWLADDALTKEERVKEGQVIINNLCSYIRSPFIPQTEKNTETTVYSENCDKNNLTVNLEEFPEEQNIRQSIFIEMSKRSTTFDPDSIGNATAIPGVTIHRGPWSDFEFDFSRAPIFYPLNNITIEKANFFFAKFYSKADFHNVIFSQKADFTGVKFAKDADFRKATFIGNVSFSSVKFANEANFNEAIFTELADFSTRGNAKTTFGGKTTFNNTHFFREANFTEVTFDSAVDFSSHNDTKTIFIGEASFNGANFTHGANFNEAIFRELADFSTRGNAKTTFGGKTTFNGTHFTEGADFTEVTFTDAVDFSTQGDTKTTFVSKASFNGVSFAREAHFDKVKFIEAADFSPQGNTKTIFEGKATFNGTHFTREANFTEVTFNESVDFSAQGDIKTVFGEKATFNDVQFHKETLFNTVIFEGIADFSTKKIESFNETFMSDAEFVNTHFKNTAIFSYVHSHSNNNSHKIYFKQVEFHEDSLFNNTEFLTDVHFEKAVFHGEAKFNDATFLKSVKFYNKTKFQNKAIFSGLTVLENTDFESVFFGDKSYFNGAELGNPALTNQQKTCFYESRFDEVADFSNAHFYSINKFIDLYFHKEVYFYGSEFTDDTFFMQNPGKLYAFNNFTNPKYEEKAEFSDAKFEGKLHFENIEFTDGADFIRAVFHKESNFENILFKNSSPDFEDAKFTVNSSHRFTTSQNSIPCRRKKVRVPQNNKFKARKIPIGSYLFDNDPDNPIAGPA